MPVYGLTTVQGQLDDTLLIDRLVAMLSSGVVWLVTKEVLVLLALVSAAARLIPARRASRIDPVQALRYE